MCQTQCGDCSSRKRRDVGQLTDDPWYELSPSGPYRFVDREQGEDKGLLTKIILLPVTSPFNSTLLLLLAFVPNTEFCRIFQVLSFGPNMRSS